MIITLFSSTLLPFSVSLYGLPTSVCPVLTPITVIPPFPSLLSPPLPHLPVLSCPRPAPVGYHLTWQCVLGSIQWQRHIALLSLCTVSLPWNLYTPTFLYDHIIFSELYRLYYNVPVGYISCLVKINYLPTPKLLLFFSSCITAFLSAIMSVANVAQVQILHWRRALVPLQTLQCSLLCKFYHLHLFLESLASLWEVCATCPDANSNT